MNRRTFLLFPACEIFLAAVLTYAPGCHQAKAPVAADNPASTAQGPAPVDVPLTPLFARDGIVKDGWTVREWDDVARPPHKEAHWFVREGILHGPGGLPDDVWIGTWLLSEKEYENFILDFDFHLGGPRGNGGIALRAPLHGDPAFDGMELQLTDEHYQHEVSPDAKANQLTGAIYLGVWPRASRSTSRRNGTTCASSCAALLSAHGSMAH